MANTIQPGFNSAFFAPVAEADLALLLAFDPAMLTPQDLALPSTQLFNDVTAATFPKKAVLVIFQDNAALGAPIPGISGKATPALFYQLRLLSNGILTFVRVGNLHGTNVAFAADCSLLNPTPVTFTIRSDFVGNLRILSSLGVDYYRSIVLYAALFLATEGAMPAHPIVTLQTMAATGTGPTGAPSTSTTGVSAANANPLFEEGGVPFSKTGSMQKGLYDKLKFWYHFNDQSMTQTLENFGGMGVEDIDTPYAVDLILNKLSDRQLLLPGCSPENIKQLILAHCVKILTQHPTTKALNSINIQAFAPANADGSLYVFKKSSDPSKQDVTDPHLSAAILDLFDIITTCFTPNGVDEKRRKEELLARINSSFNDLQTVGNMQGADIDVQVAWVNKFLFDLFHIPNELPFRGIKKADLALNAPFWAKVSESLLFLPAQIRAITSEGLQYPRSVRKQFGSSKVPAIVPGSALTASQKRKQTKEANAATKKIKQLTVNLAKVTAANTSAPVLTAPNIKAIGSGGNNSVHCVNQAAVLMASQWPSAGPPPGGCKPLSGNPCTRQHTMHIVPGTRIAQGLIDDLTNGVDGIKGPTAKVFKANFKSTLLGWK